MPDHEGYFQKQAPQCLHLSLPLSNADTRSAYCNRPYMARMTISLFLCVLSILPPGCVDKMNLFNRGQVDAMEMRGCHMSGLQHQDLVASAARSMFYRTRTRGASARPLSLPLSLFLSLFLSLSLSFSLSLSPLPLFMICQQFPVT